MKTTPMTKAEEINELRKFVDCMNAVEGGTYIGDWLKEALPFVESYLKQDIIPACTMQAGQIACEEMKLETEKACQVMIGNAQREIERDRANLEARKKAFNVAIRNATIALENMTL